MQGGVEIDEKAVLFTAESFGGKSTLTDYFIQKGHTLISDDKVGTHFENRRYHAIPSYPYYRPYRKQEDLGYRVEHFSHKSGVIHCIYELVKADAQSEILIRELYGIEKFKSLGYSSEINIPFLSSQRFMYLSGFAKDVRLFQVSIPWELKRLEEVYQKLIEHLHTI